MITQPGETSKRISGSLSGKVASFCVFGASSPTSLGNPHPAPDNCSNSPQYKQYFAIMKANSIKSLVFCVFAAAALTLNHNACGQAATPTAPAKESKTDDKKIEDTSKSTAA